ncbi:MAG TPA: hypothetical protein VIH94_02810 [Candidatus Limnocylindrales bacterium]
MAALLGPRLALVDPAAIEKGALVHRVDDHVADPTWAPEAARQMAAHTSPRSRVVGRNPEDVEFLSDLAAAPRLDAQSAVDPPDNVGGALVLPDEGIVGDDLRPLLLALAPVAVGDDAARVTAIARRSRDPSRRCPHELPPVVGTHEDVHPKRDPPRRALGHRHDADALPIQEVGQPKEVLLSSAKTVDLEGPYLAEEPGRRVAEEAAPVLAILHRDHPRHVLINVALDDHDIGLKDEASLQLIELGLDRAAFGLVLA